jgi:GntR family transcriptional regulator, arabinose operon transcriptional repressor
METLNVTYNSKAVRVSQQILDDISSRKFNPGTMLPTEMELAKNYKVSRITLRRSLGILTEQKKLTKLPYQGMLVPMEGSGERFLNILNRVGQRTTLAAVWAVQPDLRIVKMREGIRRYAQLHDLDFRIFLSPQGHEQTLDTLNNIERCNVDGVIVVPFENESYLAVLKKLLERNFPVVSVRTIGDLPMNSVETDSFSSGYQAAYYLIDKYQAPAHYFSSPLEENPTRERYAGYAKAMAEAGYAQSVIKKNSHFVDIHIDDPSFWALDKNWLPGFHGGENLFKQIEFPANIVCSNDNMAKGLYEAAAKHHLVVGKDLRIVGIDDLPLAKLLSPPLTTINSPKEEVGYEAAKILHGLIKDKSQPVMHIHLPVELIIRDSA